MKANQMKGLAAEAQRAQRNVEIQFFLCVLCASAVRFSYFLNDSYYDSLHAIAVLVTLN